MLLHGRGGLSWQATLAVPAPGSPQEQGVGCFQYQGGSHWLLCSLLELWGGGSMLLLVSGTVEEELGNLRKDGGWERAAPDRNPHRAWGREMPRRDVG